MLGGAVNQAISGLQSTAQDSFNALPSAPPVPDIDLSPRTLTTSLADGVTGALTWTPTPTAMGAGVASIVAASVIANKAKEVSTLQRTVADLEGQRDALSTHVSSLQGTLSATQQELSSSLETERQRVASLQQSLAEGERAAEQAAAQAAQAADKAAAAQAALQANVQVCGGVHTVLLGDVDQHVLTFMRTTGAHAAWCGGQRDVGAGGCRAGCCARAQ